VRNLRQAAQQALDALEQYKGVVVTHHDPESFRRMEVDGGQAARDAIAALRAALAEPGSDYERGFVDGMSEQARRSVDKAVNHMAQTTHWEGCEAVHPECRKPEPVAYCTLEQLAALKLTVPSSDKIALYTAPTPRKPLTDEEIWRKYQGLWPFHPAAEPKLAADIAAFARAIERAHGIGGEA